MFDYILFIFIILYNTMVMSHLKSTPKMFMLHSVITAFGSEVHAYDVLRKSILSVMMLLGKKEVCEL